MTREQHLYAAADNGTEARDMAQFGNEVRAAVHATIAAHHGYAAQRCGCDDGWRPVIGDSVIRCADCRGAGWIPLAD